MLLCTEDLESYRQALRNEASATLSHTNDHLAKTLSEIQLRDKAALDDVTQQMATLLLPLTSEHVETSFSRNGKQVTEVISIGQRVQDLKDLVLKSQIELKSLWNEWDQIQNDIVELGTEVLGEENGRETGVTRGYAAHVAAWDSELQQQVRDIENEVETIASEAKQKMTVEEKEVDASLKKQQASLFAQLFAEE